MSMPVSAVYKNQSMHFGAKSAFVIPCYNEEKRIDIDEYKNSLDSFESDVFLVNNGSTDKTGEILEKLKNFNDRFKVVNVSKNEGKAEGVRQGLLEAVKGNYDYVGYIDADLAVHPREIPGFLNILDNKKDIQLVCGTRHRFEGHRVDRSLIQCFNQKIIAKMGSFLFKANLSDTQCGAKMGRKDAISSVIKEKFCTNWLFDQELMVRMYKQKLNTQQKNWLYDLPVGDWIEKGNSHRKMIDFAKAFLDYLKLVKKYGFMK